MLITGLIQLQDEKLASNNWQRIARCYWGIYSLNKHSLRRRNIRRIEWFLQFTNTIYSIHSTVTMKVHKCGNEIHEELKEFCHQMSLSLSMQMKQTSRHPLLPPSNYTWNRSNSTFSNRFTDSTFFSFFWRKGRQLISSTLKGWLARIFTTLSLSSIPKGPRTDIFPITLIHKFDLMKLSPVTEIEWFTKLYLWPFSVSVVGFNI